MATTTSSTSSSTSTSTSTSSSGLVSSLGVGSGLDLSSLLESLQEVEDQKLTAITTKQTSYEAKLTAYGTLQSALETFSTATEALSDSSLYTTKKTSTNTSFTATAESTASTGSYSVQVTQLATAQTLASATQSSKTTELGDSSLSSRTVTITVGSNTAVNVTLTNSQTTLSGIASAINSAKAGVTASIIQSGDSSYQLTLTSDDTGEASTFTVSSDDTTLNGIIGYDGDSTSTSNGMTEQVAAQNAKLTVNGISIERSSNTVTDVPAEGVTLELSSVSSSAETLTVSKSITDAVSAVSDWVDAYNTLLSSFATLSKYTSVDAGESQSSDNGALVGDSVLSSIKTQLKSLLSHAQSSDTYKVITQLGISIESSSKDDNDNTIYGTLSLDDETLINALTEDASAVSDFFVGNGKTTGLATQMVSAISTYTDDDGVIDGAEEGVQSIIDKLADNYTATQSQIETRMARYKKQFVALDVLVSELNSTSDTLTSMFDQLTSSSS
ncbi:flagellar filament capping protein FliD [Musicola paradisiaca]|uniref:Flagellar hook-associated protein 2 n=1 Tax=Musicola paradisiaca (strain Ech703) TaxID=579405 RepID=C6C371_MUSP7|nr:flagellar filament capping protein FliD [Musicola paradisiaca]ACS85336.1 flagellar hook-associated 2 domain protein [Musicola paradisiaca Ech703]